MATTDMTHLDEEISRHRAALSKLYAQRNSLSLTFRLPVETLQSIFIDLVRDYYINELPSGIATPAVPTWVNVSYVCRHWRHVALNSPTLWTYIFVASPRWTEELLARSKEAPLKLGANMGFRDEFQVLRFVEQVMNHAARIQECHLDLTLREFQVFSELSSRAPRLQSLTISTTITPPEWERPTLLFDGDTPALRRLDLVFCPVSWYSLKLSGLTTLSLRHIPVQSRQNVADFLATLRCMQNLTLLFLENSLDSAVDFLSTVTFHTFQKFDLPYLSRLWINAPLSAVIALLSCITIPQKTEVRLECGSESGLSPGYSAYIPLSSWLAQRFNDSNYQEPSSQTIRSLIINFVWEVVTITFNASERDGDLSLSRPYEAWGYNIPLQLVVYFEPIINWDDRDRIINDIYCSIPLKHVQSLHTINPPVSSVFWSKTLGHLPDLRHLKLSEGAMPDLASVLSVTPQDRTDNQVAHASRDRHEVLAPGLEELELYGVSFFTPQENELPLGVRLLYDTLSGRKPDSRGQLTMVGCYVTKGHFLDMVGRWENGKFHVVEESSRPLPGFESGLEGSHSGSGSDLLEESASGDPMLTWRSSH